MDSRYRWMYGERTTLDFYNGVQEFCKAASEHRRLSGAATVLCPCRDCNNVRKWPDIAIIEDHLLRRGFKQDYDVWYWHGEDMERTRVASSAIDSVDRADIVENEEDCYPYGTDVNNLNVEVPDGSDDDSDRDEGMSEMMGDMQEQLISDPDCYASVAKAAQTPLYPGCEDFSILSAMATLFNIKAKGNWTDSSFTELLEALSRMFPRGNEIPKSTYYAKKLMCPLGLEYERIHACPNDCVLYRKEYENLAKCPVCGMSRYKDTEPTVEGDETIDKQSKRSAAKVLWYLPIIPRFKRLFSIKKDAKNLRWHAERRIKDGQLRHPADAEQWHEIDKSFPDFGDEPRNLRLALCTDGMNPFGSQNNQRSSWPVLLSIYNLPPWLCTKRKYLMMPLLISGPRQPGDDIDVYLAPLIDELRLLWDQGVPMFDAHTSTNFTLRAMIFCTVNDFPAYGNLSGYKVKGEQGCPVCEEDMQPLYLKNTHKNVFMNHRRFLDRYHPYRRKKRQFNGCIENGLAREPRTGVQIYERIKHLNRVYGKTTKRTSKKGVLWKRVSILWDLPYWKHLRVRHCLDVMHIEKNICDALVGTLLNIPGKTKDGLGVRLDMEKQGIRENLWAQPTSTGKMYLPPACYTMSSTEKRLFCECLYGIKVPSGFCSNLKAYVTKKDLKLTSMKSHDCHVMMQVFLPVAIRGLLPDNVRHVVIKLCLLFESICSSVIAPAKCDELQAEIVETLCKFEMYFPPSFFDIMVHLVVDLVREIKICGPVHLRWMYPFERFFKTIKDKAKNKARPEASIIRGYLAEEIGEFCADFIDRIKPIGVTVSRHEGRLSGKGTLGRKLIVPVAEDKQKAHLYVLQHLSVIHPYIVRHLNILRRRHPRNERAVMLEHNKTFISWFEHEVATEKKQSNHKVSDLILLLARGPRKLVHSYEGYDINGYSFYTRFQDGKGVQQNSGVMVTAQTTEFASSKDMKPLDATTVYYGSIQEIWELDYINFTVALFKCKWVDNRQGRLTDELGFTVVDPLRFHDTKEPFVLASHAKQVFYVPDNVRAGWQVVIHGKRHILGVEDVVDEDEYDQFDDIPPTSTGVRTSPDDEDFDLVYMRADLDRGEGVEVDCI